MNDFERPKGAKKAESNSPESLLTELDGPRPLSFSFRDRLERALLERRDEPALPGDDQLLTHLDVPRPLPPRLRMRLEGALAAEARPPARRIWYPRMALGAAAAIAVFASLLVASRSDAPDPRARSSIAEGRPAQPGGENVPGPSAGEGDRSSSGSESAPGGDGRTGRVDATRPGAPPFANRGQNPPAASTKKGPLKIAVAGGDPAQEAGFRGYVSVLNQSGGIRGLSVEIADRNARDALVAVNLGGDAIATAAGPPEWVQGSLLETMSATEEVLKGRVWSMSSPPERQAHLLALSVFPQPSPSSVAVIYRGTKGVFAKELPVAFRAALESRSVRIFEFDYEPGRLVPLVPADAVFLSLDQNGTVAFLDYARSAGYLTSTKVACIFPMLDTRVLNRLGEGYLVLSPYSLGSQDEARALAQASGRPISSATIHGWVTAKSLAVALWRSGADSQQSVTDAIRDLEGYEHGFAPAYARRRGSNARTPDGILYRVRGGQFVADSGFVSDPL